MYDGAKTTNVMTLDELAAEFEAVRGPLQSYLLRLTASVTEAEDIVQDTYLKAHAKIGTFRAESSLKTWLFAIAANTARDHLKSRKRWPENVTDLAREAALGNQQFFSEAMQINQSSPHGRFEIKEHIAFCFTCVSKSLPLEQHMALLLKEVYEFKVAAIAKIIDQSESMVKYYLRTGRERMIEIFDNRCSLINKTGACHQCTELNGIFNPKQKAAEEVAKITMAREAKKRSREDLFDLRMEILKGIDPFRSDSAELQLHHLEHNRAFMEKFLSEKD